MAVESGDEYAGDIVKWYNENIDEYEKISVRFCCCYGGNADAVV